MWYHFYRLLTNWPDRGYSWDCPKNGELFALCTFDDCATPKNFPKEDEVQSVFRPG